MFIAAKEYVQDERTQGIFFGAALATMMFCKDDWKWYVVGSLFLLCLLFQWAAWLSKKRSNGLVQLDS